MSNYCTGEYIEDIKIDTFEWEECGEAVFVCAHDSRHEYTGLAYFENRPVVLTEEVVLEALDFETLEG